MELNSRPTMCLLSAKQSIENWNVRSMFQTGKTAIAAAEMRRYNLADFDIYGGDFRQGVVFMLSKDAFNTLLELTEVNERKVEAKFETWSVHYHSVLHSNKWCRRNQEKQFMSSYTKYLEDSKPIVLFLV